MAGALLNQSFISISKSNHSRTSPSSTFNGHNRPRPIRVAASVAQNQSYLSSIDTDTDAHLRRAIPVKHPVSVFEPMHHLTLDAPKTTASALCVAACELVGGERDDAMEAASAIHLMHATAYAHENLPLTDRAKPKPKSSVEHRFGPNIELLTGDGMMPYGLELLARSRKNADKVLRVIVEITRAVGARGVVDGQYREFEIEQAVIPRNKEWVKYVCEKKEGALHACAAACEAILGGGSEEEIERLRRFGLYVGMMQGMLYGVGKDEVGKVKIVDSWRVMARKELEYFDSKKIERISRIFGL